MNNPKLTNVLLIALIAVNVFLLIGLVATNHRRHENRFAMHFPFHGRHHNGFASRFNYGGGFHNHHRGGYYGGNDNNFGPSNNR